MRNFTCSWNYVTISKLLKQLPKAIDTCNISNLQSGDITISLQKFLNQKWNSIWGSATSHHLCRKNKSYDFLQSLRNNGTWKHVMESGGHFSLFLCFMNDHWSITFSHFLIKILELKQNKTHIIMEFGAEWPHQKGCKNGENRTFLCHSHTLLVAVSCKYHIMLIPINKY